MKPENWIAIGSAFFSGLVTAVGLWMGPKIAVKRALEQFRSQKWWEKQQDVYTQVLEHLAIIKHCMAAYVAHAEHPEYMLGPHKQFQEQTPLAVAKLQHFAAMGAYYLSPVASEALDTFVSRWGLDTGMGNVDELKRRLEVSSQALELIRVEANKNLQSSS